MVSSSARAARALIRCSNHQQTCQEYEVRAAGENGFGDVGLGDADAQVVVDGPEAGGGEAVRVRS